MNLEKLIPTEVQTLRTVLSALGRRSDHLLNDKVVPKTLLDVSLLEPKKIDLDTFNSTIGQLLASNSLLRLEDVVETHVEKTLALYTGFLEVLVVHFGFLPDTETSLFTCIRWMSLSAQDKLESYYKIQSCILFSLVTQQDKLICEIPEFPDWIAKLGDRPGFLQGGKLWRMSRRAINSDIGKREIGAFYALVNVKRAGLAISNELQNAALAKHKKNMVGAEFKPSPSCVIIRQANDKLPRIEKVEPEMVLSDILAKVEKLVERDYSGKKCRSKWRAPSINACYEFSAKSCGSHAFWREDPWTTICRLMSPELLCFASCNHKYFPVLVPYHPDDLMRELKLELLSSEINLKAKVHKVLEPFKCRIITAGPGKLYQAGRCIQKSLHSIMRQNDLFQLTGRPVDKDIIKKRFEGVILSTLENDDFYFKLDYLMSFYVAGDYSAATDGMHPKISERFVDHLYKIGYLSSYEHLVASKCMEGHTLEYRDEQKKLTEVTQTWGQLMGSPISFPILNYGNAAVNWVAAEYYCGRPLSYFQWVNNFRPLFNGDDVCFVSNPVHYEIWRSVASCAGLNSSLGKSYCSPEFVMINSEIFVPHKKENGEVVDFDDVFVLNPGLIKGQAKVMEDTRSSEIKYSVSDCKYVLDRDWKTSSLQKLLPLVDQLEMATRKCTAYEREQCRSIFLNHVMDRLKKSNRPWSIPRMLGGLGLQNVGHVTFSQRKAIAMILMQEDMRRFVSAPRESPDCLQTANGLLSDLEHGLQCRYTKNRFVPSDTVSPAAKLLYGEYDDSFSFDNYVFGEEVECIGKDRYSHLLKEALKAPWVDPISDEALTKYMNGEMFFLRRERVRPIITC